MTSVRSRIGRACTAAKPTSAAAAVNRGQRPAAAQVGHRHRLAGAEAVHAGALVGLQLEQLQQPGPFRGGGHHLQRALLVGQQQPGRGDAQQLDAPLGQHVQEVDHVEVVDERVGHLDEHVGQLDLGHLTHPLPYRNVDHAALWPAT